MLYTIDTRNDLMDRLGFDPDERDRLDARDFQQQRALRVQRDAYKLAQRAQSPRGCWYLRQVVAPAAKAGMFAPESERVGHLEHAYGLIGGMLDDLDGYGMARWANEIRALRRRARDAADTARTAWGGD